MKNTWNNTGGGYLITKSPHPPGILNMSGGGIKSLQKSNIFFKQLTCYAKYEGEGGEYLWHPV